jgi:AraC family transcriptional regulator
VITLRESLTAVEELSVSHSSLGRNWDGIDVFEADINAGSEITLPPFDRHFIAMVLSGATDVVQRRDTKRYHSMARAGTVMIVPAGVSSYFSSSRVHKTSRTEIPIRLLNGAAEELGLTARGGAELQSVFETRDPVIAHLIGVFLEELRKPAHPAQRLVVSACSNALAAHLVRSFDAQNAALPKGPASLTRRQLRAVLDYLESNIAAPIELAEIAAVANVSRFHFVRLFKASTGVSPMAYLEVSRIDRARALIRAGEMRLSEIALVTGFADQSHFTRRFHKHTGVTPGYYEREHGSRRRT